MTEEKKKKQSSLGSVKQFQLFKAVEGHKNEFENKAYLSVEEAAKQLSIEVGFEVTWTNIKTALRATAIRASYKGRHQRGPGTKFAKLVSRVTELEDLVLEMTKEQDRSQRWSKAALLSLRALYKKLAHVPPSDFDRCFRDAFPDGDPTPTNDAKTTTVANKAGHA